MQNGIEIPTGIKQELQRLTNVYRHDAPVRQSLESAALYICGDNRTPGHCTNAAYHLGFAASAALDSNGVLAINMLAGDLANIANRGTR